MVILSASNQRLLHSLKHMPQGMPLFGRRGPSTATTRLLQTKLVRWYTGPDTLKWVKLTEAGRNYVAATSGTAAR